MPFKVFSNLDYLDETDLNDYLMRQAVIRFDTAAARDAAIPTPTAGMVVYTADTDTVWRYSAGAWTRVTGHAWTNVTGFGTGWGNFGGTTWEVARFRKDINNGVHLEGMVVTSTASNANAIFTLPVGYRPMRSHLISVTWNPNAGGCRLLVAPTGAVSVYTLDVSSLVVSTWVNLAGVTFTAEQ